MKTNIEPGCMAILKNSDHCEVADPKYLGHFVTVIEKADPKGVISWNGNQLEGSCACTIWLIEGIKNPNFPGSVAAHECILMRLDDPDFTEDEECKDEILSIES